MNTYENLIPKLLVLKPGFLYTVPSCLVFKIKFEICMFLPVPRGNLKHCLNASKVQLKKAQNINRDKVLVVYKRGLSLNASN